MLLSHALHLVTSGALLVTNEDEGAEGRVYISKVKIGDVTFHSHSTVDKAQVRPLPKLLVFAGYHTALYQPVSEC